MFYLFLLVQIVLLIIMFPLYKYQYTCNSCMIFVCFKLLYTGVFVKNHAIVNYSYIVDYLQNLLYVGVFQFQDSMFYLFNYVIYVNFKIYNRLILF